MADVLAGVVHCHEAFLMERNQIVDAIHLIQREIRVNAVRPRCAGNEPAAADTALEFVTIESVSPVHDELKIVEFPPVSITDCPCRFIRVQLIQARLDFSLFRALEVDLPPSLGVGCFVLVFGGSLFPFAKGEGGKADVDVAVLDRGNFLPILLVDTGKILRLICWNPFPLVLFQTVHCRKLKPPAVLSHGYVHPCTALVILNHPSDLAVDAVDCANHLLSAVVARDFLDILRNFLSFPL